VGVEQRQVEAAPADDVDNVAVAGLAIELRRAKRIRLDGRAAEVVEQAQVVASRREVALARALEQRDRPHRIPRHAAPLVNRDGEVVATARAAAVASLPIHRARLRRVFRDAIAAVVAQPEVGALVEVAGVARRAKPLGLGLDWGRHQGRLLG
jgi:hypothetical protein